MLCKDCPLYTMSLYLIGVANWLNTKEPFFDQLTALCAVKLKNSEKTNINSQNHHDTCKMYELFLAKMKMCGTM